jgi:hypothetical protein
MKELNKNLSEMFDINPLEVKQSQSVIPAPEELSDEAQEDFAFARSNIRNLIRQGTGAVDNILEVARESEHPRAYEVVSTLIKTMADMNKDLIDIQKKKKEMVGGQASGKPQDNQTINVDKAVFVGSTTDLIKQMKEKKNGNND